MTYIKQAHQVIIKDAQGIIERRKDTLDETEAVQYGAFCGFIDEMEAENRKIQERTAEQMKKYSKTEKGKETNRRSQRAFQQRKREAKKKESS